MSLESFLKNASVEGLSVYSFTIFHAGGFSQVWFASIDPDKNVSYQGHLFSVDLEGGQAVKTSMSDLVYVIHHSRPAREKESREE